MPDISSAQVLHGRLACIRRGTRGEAPHLALSLSFSFLFVSEEEDDERGGRETYCRWYRPNGFEDGSSTVDIRGDVV